jgi:hypothetical protein
LSVLHTGFSCEFCSKGAALIASIVNEAVDLIGIAPRCSSQQTGDDEHQNEYRTALLMSTYVCETLHFSVSFAEHEGSSLEIFLIESPARRNQEKPQPHERLRQGRKRRIY